MNRIRVLFLCTGNSARSILAEALLKKLGGDDFEVYSAGTAPKGVNPYSLRVLAANEIEASGAESKPMSQFEHQRFDYVITLCDDAAENCPMFPGHPERIHWSFTDPAAVGGTDVEKLAAFQAILNGLRQRISLFVITARRVAAEAGVMAQKEGAR